MIGDRIARARAVAGMSMRALAEKVGVSANMIKKYEHNLSMPGSDKLIKLAQALDVRSDYFFRAAEAKLTNIEYRKRSATPKRVLRRIESDAIDQFERWQELVDLYPQRPIPPFKMPDELPSGIRSYNAIDSFSDKLRSVWGLGLNPIYGMIDVLESKGLVVIASGVDTGNRVDGLQAAVDDRPLIVISEHWPGDRQRFTLAHELGHLLLHKRLARSLDEEKACHRFAGSFLLPASAARRQLGQTRQSIEARELYMLKREFGLSMQACFRRAAELGIISDRLKKKLLATFSKKGWLTKEPGEPYPKEEPRLFKQLVYRALGEGIVSESKAAELLGMSQVRLYKTLKLESGGVRQNKNNQ